MPSSLRKPLIGLILLLACPLAGLGGRAEAGFLLHRPSDRTERWAGALRFDPHIDAEGRGEGAAYTIPSENDPAGPVPSPLPGKPRPLPARFGLDQNGGTTSSDSSSSGGPGSGLGALFLHTSDRLVGSKRSSGSLVIAERKLTSGPFVSRLFRPPR